MLSYSTGLLNYVAGTGSWHDALQKARLMIYDGAIPASADAATTGTLLCVVTKNGAALGDESENGLTFKTPPVAGLLAGDPAEVWQGTNLATGTARYFRWCPDAADDGSLSTVFKRIQGSIGTSGADMNLSSTTLTQGAIHTVPANQRSFQV